MNNARDIALDLIKFLDASPSPYPAAAEALHPKLPTVAVQLSSSQKPVSSPASR